MRGRTRAVGNIEPGLRRTGLRRAQSSRCPRIRPRGVMECGSVAGRDRVLARQLPDCDRNRGRVLIADENTPLRDGRSSRRAGTRALPEKNPPSGLEMLKARQNRRHDFSAKSEKLMPARPRCKQCFLRTFSAECFLIQLPRPRIPQARDYNPSAPKRSGVNASRLLR